MNHESYVVALVFDYHGETGVAPAHMDSFGDRYFCFGKAIQTGEVAEFFLWRVYGVAPLRPIEHVRLGRQPIEIVADQLPASVMEFELQEIGRRKSVCIREIERFRAAVRSQIHFRLPRI